MAIFLYLKGDKESKTEPEKSTFTLLKGILLYQTEKVDCRTGTAIPTHYCN